jgi:hypothetical protein
MSTQELTMEAMALPLADRILLAQALWESIEAGLPDTDEGSALREAQFLDPADRAISLLLEAPDRWRIIEKDVRDYSMPRFPYAIYYRDLSDHLRILAF